MLSVMTWNLENFERPAINAEQATKDRYARKLQQISELITTTRPDLVGVQEVLANPKSMFHTCVRFRYLRQMSAQARWRNPSRMSARRS